MLFFCTTFKENLFLLDFLSPYLLNLSEMLKKQNFFTMNDFVTKELSRTDEFGF